MTWHVTFDGPVLLDGERVSAIDVEDFRIGDDGSLFTKLADGREAYWAAGLWIGVVKLAEPAVARPFAETFRAVEGGDAVS